MPYTYPVDAQAMFEERYVGRGRPDLAALAYGAAKFPCLAEDARRTAAVSTTRTGRS